MLRIAALAIMVLGVKASVDTNFFEKFANDNSAEDEENGGTKERAETCKDFGMESNSRPDGEDGVNFKTYLEYLSILGMLTTAAHYLMIHGERKTSNHKTKN